MEKHIFKVYRLCADAYGVDETAPIKAIIAYAEELRSFEVRDYEATFETLDEAKAYRDSIMCELCDMQYNGDGSAIIYGSGIDEGYEDSEFAYFYFTRNIDFAWKTNR